MGIVTTIRTEIARQSRVDAALTTSIADYLAVENREDVCRAHVIQAEEIIAMVRESDRDMRNGGL